MNMQCNNDMPCDVWGPTFSHSPSGCTSSGYSPKGNPHISTARAKDRYVQNGVAKRYAEVCNARQAKVLWVPCSRMPLPERGANSVPHALKGRNWGGAAATRSKRTQKIADNAVAGTSATSGRTWPRTGHCPGHGASCTSRWAPSSGVTTTARALGPAGGGPTRRATGTMTRSLIHI